MAEKIPPSLQQALLDFDATVTAKPNLTNEELHQKFPEFRNDDNLLQSAHDYSATKKSGKYKDVETLNSKFPEFDEVNYNKSQQTQQPVTQQTPLQSQFTPASLKKAPEQKLPIPQTPDTQEKNNYGLRADGTKKGTGFLGVLKRPDGRVSSELSIGIEFDGKETEIPTLVPTLNKDEINYLLNVPASKMFTQNPTIFKSIKEKAIAHAKERMNQGKSPFAENNESPESPYATPEMDTEKTLQQGIQIPKIEKQQVTSQEKPIVAPMLNTFEVTAPKVDKPFMPTSLKEKPQIPFVEKPTHEDEDTNVQIAYGLWKTDKDASVSMAQSIAKKNPYYKDWANQLGGLNAISKNDYPNAVKFYDAIPEDKKTENDLYNSAYAKISNKDIAGATDEINVGLSRPTTGKNIEDKIKLKNLQGNIAYLSGNNELINKIAKEKQILVDRKTEIENSYSSAGLGTWWLNDPNWVAKGINQFMQTVPVVKSITAPFYGIVESIKEATNGITEMVKEFTPETAALLYTKSPELLKDKSFEGFTKAIKGTVGTMFGMIPQIYLFQTGTGLLKETEEATIGTNVIENAESVLFAPLSTTLEKIGVLDKMPESAKNISGFLDLGISMIVLHKAGKVVKKGIEIKGKYDAAKFQQKYNEELNKEVENIKEEFSIIEKAKKGEQITQEDINKFTSAIEEASKDNETPIELFKKQEPITTGEIKEEQQKPIEDKKVLSDADKLTGDDLKKYLEENLPIGDIYTDKNNIKYSKDKEGKLITEPAEATPTVEKPIETNIKDETTGTNAPVSRLQAEGEQTNIGGNISDIESQAEISENLTNAENQRGIEKSDQQLKDAGVSGRTAYTPLTNIIRRPDVFQYKGGGDVKGVNKNEVITGKYNPNLAGTIQVWRDVKNEVGGGENVIYLVDGHHRMDAMERNNIKDTDVFFIDAPTIADAKVEGAKANIAQGRGTSIDAAKVFKNATPEQLEGFEPPSKVGREGRELAKLNDEIFALIVDEKLSIDKGIAIAQVDKLKQNDFYNFIKKATEKGKKMTKEGWMSVAEDINVGDIASKKTKEATLFEVSESEQFLLLEQSQLKADIKSNLSKDAKILSSANKNQEVLKKAGNVVAIEENQKLSEEARIASGLFDTYKNRKSVSDIIKDGTIKLSEAKGNKAKKTIREQIITDVKDAIQKELDDDFKRPPPPSAEGKVKSVGQVKAEKEYNDRLAEIEQEIKDAEKSKQNKLDKLNKKAELFGDVAKKNELLGEKQDLSKENIDKQLKPFNDIITNLEKEKQDFIDNKEKYLKKYEGQIEIPVEVKPEVKEVTENPETTQAKEPTEKEFEEDLDNETSQDVNQSTVNSQLPLNPKENKELMESDLNNVVTLRQIGRDLSKAIGLKDDYSLRYGLIKRFRKKALGLFFPESGIIRVNNINDLRVLGHEIGHKLDFDILKITPELKNETKKHIKELTKELINLTKESNFPKSQQKRTEGIAEFVSQYIINPDFVIEKTPKFYSFFEKMLNQNMDIKNALQNARKTFQEYSQQDPRLLIESTISREQKDNSFLNGIRKIKWNKIVYNIFDNIKYIRDIDNALKKQGIKQESFESSELAVLSTIGVDGKAKQFLENHPFERKGNDIIIRKDTDGLMKIINPLIKNNTFKEYEGYLVAKHNIELYNNEKPNAATLSKEVSQQAIDLYEKKYGKETLDKFTEQLRKYNNSLLDYYIESGKMSKKIGDELKEKYYDYVPFKRYFDEFEKQQFRYGKKLSQTSPSPIKKIYGSSRELISPFESMIKNTYDILVSSDRNIALKNIVNSLKQISHDLVQEIPVGNVKQVFDLKTGEQTFTYSKEPPKNKNIVTVWENGEMKFYEIPKEYYDSFFSINENVSDAIRVLSLPSRWLQAGAVVYDPTFVFRNIPRDQISATFYSKYNYSPVDFIKGISNVLKKTDEYQKWLASGADQSFLVDTDIILSKKYLNEKISGRLKSRYDFYKRNPLRIIQDMSKISEIGTRVGAFKNAYLKTGDALKSMKEAREISGDYGIKGAAMKSISPLYPFLNARMQHLRLSTKTIKENPLSTTTKGLMFVTAPSLINWILNNYNDESKKRYQSLPTWRKLGFFNIHIPYTDSYIPLPKGTFGQIFGSSIESFLDWTVNNESSSAKGLPKQLLNEVSPVSNWLETVPQFARPVIEEWANKQGFTGKPIVPEALKGLNPSEQYTDYTPMVIKKLGETTNLSPLRISHILQGYGGGATTGGIRITDQLLQLTGLVDKDTDDTWTKLSKLPLTKAFITGTPIGTRSRYTEEFYDKMDELEEIWHTVTNYIKDDNQNKLKSYLDEGREKDLKWYLNNQTNINKYKDILRYTRSLKYEIVKDKSLKNKIESINNIEKIISDISISFRDSYISNNKFDLSKEIQNNFKIKETQKEETEKVNEFKKSLKLENRQVSNTGSNKKERRIGEERK